MHTPANTHSDSSPAHHATIVRSVVVNILGSCDKALMPVHFILITRLFGPATMGVYYLAFVIQQNLNRTFNTFVTNLDVLMLGYFGLGPEVIGLCGIGSQIVRNISQIKPSFAGSYAPVIVRQHKAGDRVGMGAAMEKLLASTVITLLQLVETRYLIGVRMDWRCALPWHCLLSGFTPRR